MTISAIDPGALREAISAGLFDGEPWWGDGSVRRLQAVTLSRTGMISVDESIANEHTQLLFLLAEARCPRRDKPVWTWGNVTAEDLRRLVKEEAHAYADWDRGEGALDWPMRIEGAAEAFVRRLCRPLRHRVPA